MKKTHYLLMAALPFFVLSACEEKSPAEKAADDIEDAAEEVGDAIEDATD